MAADNTPDDDARLEPPFGIRRVLKPVTTLHLLARPLGVDLEDRDKSLQANVRIDTVLLERPAGPGPKDGDEPEPNFTKKLFVMEPKRAGQGPPPTIGSMQADFKLR